MVKILNFLSAAVMFLTLIYMTIAVSKELGIKVVVGQISPNVLKTTSLGKSPRRHVEKILFEEANPFGDGETLTADDLSKND